MFDKMKLVLFCKQALCLNQERSLIIYASFHFLSLIFLLLSSAKYIVAHIISKKEASDYNRRSNESNLIISDWFKKERGEREKRGSWCFVGYEIWKLDLEVGSPLSDQSEQNSKEVLGLSRIDIQGENFNVLSGARQEEKGQQATWEWETVGEVGSSSHE